MQNPEIKPSFLALVCAFAFLVCGSTAAAQNQDIQFTCNKPQQDAIIYYLRYSRYGDTEGAVNDGIGTCRAGQQASMGRKYRSDYVEKNGGKIGLRVVAGETAYFFGVLRSQPDKIILTWSNGVPSVMADGARLTRYDSAAKMTEALRPQ